MGAADTNVLLRLLLDDDVEQARAARSFQRSHAPLFVSHVVLAELAWVLSSGYRFSRQRLHALLEMLLDTDGFALEEPNVVQAALAHHRASAAEFSDCLILAIAQSASATPLGTFDRGLGRLAGVQRLGRRGR
jgi:predicted nucleic-acid-binding protein